MDLIEAVKVTYEIVGQPITDWSLRAVVQELSVYPQEGVCAALERCRRELRRLTLADILDRLPHGHPGVEEAWGIVAKALRDEYRSLVMTEEIQEAFGVALALSDDTIAARMAFKEKYAALVTQARQTKAQPVWSLSKGYDVQGREDAVQEAVQLGRITVERGQALLPMRVRAEALALETATTSEMTRQIGKDMR